MSFWISFWAILLVAALAFFGGLAIVVAIGGFRDIREMLSRLEAQRHDDSDESDN